MAADRTTIRRPDLVRQLLGNSRFAGSRRRTIAISVVGILVLVVGLAMALGGTSSPKVSDASGSGGNGGTVNGLGVGSGVAGSGSRSSSAGSTAPALPPTVTTSGLPSGDLGGETAGNSPTYNSAGSAPEPGAASVPQSATKALSIAPADDITGSSAAATKIVKTGTIELTVKKGQVASTITRLSALASSEGGYVSTSRTNTGVDPSGSITLRVPVAKFTDALNTAAKYGRVINQSTHAQDVTGKYVDLNAQEQALAQTRSTYLTILSHATTIGATLAVQQRVDDVQQQIDELKGQIKVLSSQSSYSTLTAYVSQQGTPFAAVRHHHPRTGLSKAWHTSWSRFNRGIDALVGAIGPLVLAVILLALLALVIRISYRAAARSAAKETAPSPSH